MEIGSSTSTPVSATLQQSPPNQNTQVQQADQSQQQAELETARSEPAPDQRVGTVVDTQV